MQCICEGSTYVSMQHLSCSADSVHDEKTITTSVKNAVKINLIKASFVCDRENCKIRFGGHDDFYTEAGSCTKTADSISNRVLQFPRQIVHQEIIFVHRTELEVFLEKHGKSKSILKSCKRSNA